MIELRTLGRLELKGHDGHASPSILAHPKRVALLTYLAAATPRGFHRRDTLIALLWPEVDQEHARASLRKALFAIRQSLGAETIEGRGDEELGIGSKQVRCDAAEFDDAIAGGDAERALELYTGDMLEGVFVSDAIEFERWLDSERTRRRARASAAAWQLADSAEAAHDVFAAAKYARRAAELAPDDEAALRRLVELLDRIGDRAGSVAAYEDFAKRLATDFDLEPAQETKQLMKEVRAGRERAPAERSERANAAPTRSEQAAAARKTADPASPADPAVVASLAVLPFINLSADRDDDYFSDGMTEELIHRLSRVRGLHVAARTSSFLYKNRSAEVGDIARRLNVATLLEGSVRKSGTRLRIGAQLVDAVTGYHIWSDQYERELHDVFAVQTELADAIAGALSSELARAPGAGTRDTTDVKAFESYLKGRHFWNQRTEPALRRAIECFRDAIARDPTYARAHAGIAAAFNQRAALGFVPGREGYGEAKAAAHVALALDPELAEAYTSLGFVLAQHDFDWVESERLLLRATALDPGYATGHQWYNAMLMAVGRVDEAAAAIERARALEPLSLGILTDVARDTYLRRDYEGVLRELRVALEIDPSFARAHGALALAETERGNFAVAIESFERAIDCAGGWYPTRWGHGGLARAHALAGHAAEAEQILAMLRTEPRRYVSPEVIAIVMIALGWHDAGLTALEQALHERALNMSFTLLDPAFDPVRADARFHALLQRTGLR